MTWSLTYTAPYSTPDEPVYGHIGWLDSLKYRPRPLEERNLKYVVLGQALIHLGNMGASDEELRALARRGSNATMRDVAEIYCNNLREGDVL